MFKKKILIVDDSNFFARVIQNALADAGYDVVRAACAQEGLRLVREEKPDLTLLDVVMPDLSGFEVCRILRESESNNLMPIIMLTGQDSHEDVITGLDLGADDYICKPFDNRELLCRVKNTLKRIDRNRNANPLTGLPGNLEIQRELEYCILKQLPFAAIYADIDNFKAYNDVYGFIKGDDAIKLTSDILVDEAKNTAPESFIGHVGGDDFIIVTSPETASAVCTGVISQFDRRIRQLYTDTDLARGHITTRNRQGIVATFPIMSISLAIVTNEHKTFSCYLEVAEIAADLKKKAKSMPGSVYVRDLRRSKQ